MIKTINAWVFAPDRTLEDALALAKQNGFEAIELTIDEAGPISTEMTEAQCRDVAGQLAAHGLKLSSLASGLGWKYPITAGGDVARKGIEATRRSLQVAKWLGTDSVLLVPGGVAADFIPGFQNTDYVTAFNNARSGIAEIVAVAEDLGVTIAVENVWNKFLLSPIEFRDFIDSFGSKRVGAYFDVGNVLLTGYPDQWVRILGNRISRVHFKDFKTSVGTLDGFCMLLDGDVDYPSVVAALKSVGYDGYVTAEYFDSEALLGKLSAAMDNILGR